MVLTTPDGDESQIQGPIDAGAADTEKAATAYIEGDAELAPSETRKLLRKVDKALLPLLSVMYLLSFLDRANIGNARLAGLEEDLGMSGKWDYATVVAVFFPFYVLAEVPSNMALKLFRPSIWIPSIMVAWGVVMTLMGIVHNFEGLLATRMALGLAEGGLFPGVTFYITLWYRRYECGFRIAIFFSAATVAGAFGGLLARGIMEMHGTAGLAGWSWIFILEGILTVIIAVIAYFYLFDYPETASFLNEEEKSILARRLQQDRSSLSEEFNTKFVIDAFKDFKIWTLSLMTIGNFLPVYSVSIFLPTIIKSMGHTAEVAQLLSVPPYITACAATVLLGYAADRHRQRGIYVIGIATVAMVGFLILIVVENPSVKYFACFLVLLGLFPNVPQLASWNGNNIGGALKRGVGLAMQIGAGNMGGAVAGFIFRSEDAPHYRSGHGLLFGLCSMTLLLSLLMMWYLRRENKRRDAVYKPPAEYTSEELQLETDSGDYATFFRYTT